MYTEVVNMGGKGKGKCQTSNPSFPSPPPSPQLSDPMPIIFGTFGTEYGAHMKHVITDPNMSSPQRSDPMPIIFGTFGTEYERRKEHVITVPNTSSPQLDPMPNSSGSMGTEYEIHKKHVITDPNTSYSMTYYEGIIIHKDREHKKHNKDVCFLAFDDFDVAKQIYDLSGLISHPRVMKASSIFFDDKYLQQYLVCFDKFEGLENAKKKNSLAKQLTDPKLFATVPGNPGTFVQEEIKGLAEGLDYMHQNHVSSSNLEWSYGYVWCPVTSHVKIMLVDTSLKKEGNTRDPNKIIEATFKQFSNGLKKYFLKTSDDSETSEDLKTTEDPPKSDIIWPERGQFINCFTRSKVPIKNRMEMVINHPFLKSNIQEILEFFPRLSHALKSNLRYRGHDLTNFGSALNDPGFIQEFGFGTWGKIHEIRNIYVHELRDEVGMLQLYEDIQYYDPLLIGELEEK